ncbi:MBL fold metallo-hydrolase [Desulfosarcina widdelii]|uniref:MBL fold metallo-hydrolase n=1 Tax=Desulfosarcina widdelii TaxID=947919 RepID=A0A5K7Z9C0_9BACT|nr:MBL fold metallo-hydrolase [Desulfosarcina widdelii]BBO76453.1 MBL fold metallo-hydrolase [Desulfosarcina widdelii]
MDASPPGDASAKANPLSVSVCVLASGSRGNAIYVSDGRTAILIDAGLSGIEIQRRMAAKGLDPGGLDAILVSHEHADHIQGVGVLSRRFGLTVHISDATREASQSALGKLAAIHPFTCGRNFPIGDLVVHPFSISHDAVDPAGFTIRCNGSKVGVATDLGIATSVVKTHLQSCDILILEANHDDRMLIDGPYPWPLKQRIRGRSGHLSNEDAASLLDGLRHDRLAHVILAHLSEENNTPDIAREAIETVLQGSSTKLHVACQATGCRVLTLEKE